MEIELSEPVALTFSLKYLSNFCKAAGLSKTVKLCLSNEVPLLVEYPLAGSSYLRFYLAPKASHTSNLWLQAEANVIHRSAMKNRCDYRRSTINYGMRVTAYSMRRDGWV